MKALEALSRLYPFSFYAVVRFSGPQVLVFFRSPAGPINHHAIDFFTRAKAKCYRQFRLGKITGAPADHPRLRLPRVPYAHHRPDRIAIRLRARKVKSNALTFRRL